MAKYWLSFALNVCGFWLCAGVAQAASFAVLIGVSDYDEEIGLADLRGPSNDVILLRDVLQERAEFDIRIIADGVEGGIRPTRDAILSALDALVDDANDGDFVYVHMSGHGTQQADRNGDETDGLDEVFLPADTKRAEPGTSVIPNAIVDEELGARIKALRANGVDVWFVLDSCHSGSGLRAASPRSRARFVDPATLGVSIEAVPQSVATAAVEGPGDDTLPGGYMAFYSAQSSELAREILVDETAENGWYGLFTSRLAARLQSDPKLSYRQLFQAVLSDLDDSSIPGGARLQTPLSEGTLFDAPVFGGEELVGVRQFEVAGNRVQAGLLHGLTQNTVLALVDDAGAPVDQVLSYVQIDDLDARSAALNPVRGGCVAEHDIPCERAGTVPQEARFARLVAKPRDSVLRIAPVNLIDGTPAALDNVLVQSLTDAISAANADLGTNIEIDANASVLAGIADDRLWFGPKIAVGSTPIGVSWGPQDQVPLDAILLRISKAEDMARTFGSVAGTPSLLFPSPIKVQIQHVTSDVTQLTPTVPADLRSECRAALQVSTQTEEIPHGHGLKQCDQIAFGAQGVVQGPARDVNRIYVDSQYCVSTEYQRVEGVSRPAILGPPITICSDCPGPSGIESKAGVERMFIVVTEAEDNREALNLEGLLENCGPTNAATRSGNSTDVDGFLTKLSKSDATRGGMGGFGISNIWVEEFKWQVLPRQEALAAAGLALRE
ncbi:MAG: caspase family protein [Paracoccaceae bacterium]